MYRRFADDLIEEIRINNDIVDVVSQYVKLDRKSKYHFGLCPFHNEKTPSFSVTQSRQMFYCYGCGKAGNVINFIMEVENLDYIEAIKLLAERAKIQIPEGESREEREKAELRNELVKINTEAARFFYGEMNSHKTGKAAVYLKSRNISSQMIRKFGLGFAPEKGSHLYRHLQQCGFDENNILKAGLILPGKDGGYYDRFRGRIMFPIFDIRGNVIGFGGRVLDSSMPKYMNSPESPVYNKSTNLYGLNFAKTSGEKKIIVVEGYMDVISLHQHGIINTVASLGTALTESQGRLLKKYAEEIIISYDADGPGQAAAMRGLDLLSGIGCNVKVLSVPQGKDPDEFIGKHGKDQFLKLVDNALSLVEYKIKILKKNINTDSTEGKIEFLQKAAEILSKIDNSIEREIYAGKISKDFDISEESIFSEIYRKIRPQSNFTGFTERKKRTSGTAGKGHDDKNNDKTDYLEKMILAFLSVDNSIYKEVKDTVTLDYFHGESNKLLAEFILKRLDENRGIVPAEALTAIEGEEARLFAKIIQEECYCDDNLKAVLDIIKKIEIIRLEKRQNEILSLLNNKSVSSEGDVEKLKQELQSIIIQKKSL